MVNETLKSYLSATAGLALVLSLWYIPATRAHQRAKQAAAHAQDQPKTFQASGKVASVSGAQFTVEVQKSNGDIAPVVFNTDKDSVLDGKLAEGATVDVTYRIEAGKKIVVRAHITPPPNSAS